MPRNPSWPSQRLTGGLAAPQVQAQIAQQTPGIVAPLVPALIPPASSSRMFSQMSVQAGDVVTATTTSEQPFQSQAPIDGTTLTTGQSVILRAGGIFATGPVPLVTQQFRVRLGGIVIVDTGPISLPVNLGPARWKADVEFIVRATGSSGLIEAFGLFHFATSLTVSIPVLAGPTGSSVDTGAPVTVNTAQPLNLGLTVTFGTAPATAAGQAANTASMRICSVHTLRPV